MERTETVVRLSNVDDLLGVLPHRIGFTPTESLVVMCLCGPRRRDRLVARIDLEPSEADETVTGQLVDVVRPAQATAVFIVYYTEAVDEGGELPRRQLVDLLVKRVRKRKVQVVDALVVRGGRRWSYHCADPSCCPPDGTPLPAQLTPAAGQFVAELVSEGGSVLPSREALAASIRPPDDDDARAALAATLDEVAQEVWSVVTGSGPDELGRRTLTLLSDVLARWTAGTYEVSGNEAAWLALGLRNKRARDEAATLILESDHAVFLSLFTELARHCDDVVARRCAPCWPGGRMRAGVGGWPGLRSNGRSSASRRTTSPQLVDVGL